jgi:hypothetical protein
MKKLTFILSITLTLSAFAQVPSYVPTNGLVGWWPFNGNANDESGNGNNGVVNGAVSLTTDREGNQNAAYSFPMNSSDYIKINQNESFSTFSNGFAISIWYLSFSSNPGGRMINLGNTDACNIGFHALGFPNTGAVLVGSGCIGYGNWDNAITNQSVNTWNNLIFTINFITDEWVIYHNSNVAASGSSTGSISLPLNLSSYAFDIGRKTVSMFDSWNGKIDDIGIWNRALTPQEVTALYNGCQQSILTQPQNQTASFNENVQFTAASSDQSATYQWQTNLGLGFQNLADAGQYSGSSTNTLNVSNVTLSNNNQQFRCIIASGSCTDTSDVALLNVLDNVGLAEQNQMQLLVYPNPASSIITIENPQGLISNFVVVDAQGREVHSGTLNTATTLDLHAFPTGMYTILFENKALQDVKISKE